MKKTTLFTLIILVLTGCSGSLPLSPSPASSPATDSCSAEEIIQFLDIADDAKHRIIQLEQRAKEKSGEDLEAIIKEMQVIETDAKEIDPPTCALKAKSALVSYLGTLIQGYFRLYTQGIGITPDVNIKDNPTADDEFDLAASKLEYYETQMEELRNIVAERNK